MRQVRIRAILPNLLILPPLGLIVAFGLMLGLWSAEAAENFPQTPNGKQAGSAVSKSGVAPEVSAILEKHCLSCHGEKVRKSGLDLRDLKAMLQGGESGEPVLVPGKPEESHMLKLVADGEMPPGKRAKLTAPEVQALRKWVTSGVTPGGPSTPQGRQAEPSLSKVSLEISDLFDYKCRVCHNPAKRVAGLDLSSPSSILRGGKSGPAIVRGQGDASLLIRKLRDDQMPPRQARDDLSLKPVTEKEIELLKSWINQGAAEFPERPVIKPTADSLSDEDRKWWSFRPPERPVVPKVRDAGSVRTPIDAFLLARLEKAGLRFSREASRRSLIRRLTVDLTGLTPTPEEVIAFENDNRPNAYERLVDRLIASPRYGERWTQHWLDAAGYSESDGGDGFDPVRAEFYHYRDYVVRSLNADKPYDRFVTEQVAGDELAGYLAAPRMTDELRDNLVATGFLRTCVDPTDRPVHNFLPDRFQVLADTVSIVGSSLMGLTIGCARCHSHKYDPISHAEYYQFSAIFGAAYDPSDWKKPKDRLTQLATQRERDTAKDIDGKLVSLKARLIGLTTVYLARGLDSGLSAVPTSLRSRLTAAAPLARFAAIPRSMVATLATRLTARGHKPPATFGEYKATASAILADTAHLKAERPALPLARILTDVGPEGNSFYLLRRGEAYQRGDRVVPDVPAVLTDGSTQAGLDIAPPSPGSRTTGRRLAFARWLTRRDNPLTARVMVNRVWQDHFGAGLVATPDNFGHTGAAPTHPELLDWLAVEFMERGWSLKTLHRLIVTSQVYRQGTARVAEGMAADPANKLWWRMTLRRLDAETIRDSIMATAGTLNARMFGSSSEVAVDLEGQVSGAPSFEHSRRSVYMLRQRSKPLTMLDAFDSPRMITNCTQRRTSTVSTQALLMLNSEWAASQSQQLADRATRETGPDPGSSDRIARLAWLTMARSPSPEETQKFSAFLRDQAETYRRDSGLTEAASERQALADLGQVLYNSPEFLYTD